MVRRYELSPEQFRLIEDLLPSNGGRGEQWKDHRTVLNGIFWVLNSGAQWREMPERYGKWETVYSRFSRWRREGLFEKILRRLHLRLDEEGKIDLETWYTDATNVRASRSAAGARRRGKKGAG
jgi:transposase